MQTAPSQMTEDSMAVIVPGRTKILYGMGSFGTQFFNGVQGAATYWFWFLSYGMNTWLYTLVMVVFYNIWNAINDPIFGWISDRTKSRWGRRIPYIRFITPIWFISLLLLFLPNLTLDQVGMTIWLTVTILIFDGCYTMVAGCYNSLMPELSSLTTERTKINLVNQLFAIIGYVVAFVFPLMLAGNVMHFFYFIIIGGLCALLVLFIPSFFIRERTIPPDEKPLGLVKAVKFSIKNKPFMSFIGWNFMAQFASSTVLLQAIPYAQTVLLAGDFEKYLIFGALFITMFPGFLINKYLGKKKGVRFAVFLSTFIAASGLLLLFFSGQVMWMAVLSLMISGFGLSALLMYANVMIAEASDYDELRTNQRREAMFFGTNALFTKPAIGIANGVAAWTVTLVVSKVLANSMIMGLFPSIAMYISLIFLLFYPNLKESNEMKQELSILHASKPR